MTLYDKSLASRNLDALLDVQAPSSNSDNVIDRDEQEFMRMVTPEWRLAQKAK